MTRVAVLHTGAVTIPALAAITARRWPGVEVLNLLDDRIVADLADVERAGSVPVRLSRLVADAVAAGADAVVIACSSVSGHAARLEAEAGVPVLRIDEAMADEAVRIGGRITILATLATTLRPTAALLAERLDAAGATADVAEIIVPGAFAAVAAGDASRHDRLVGEAIAAAAATSDVIVLAQASMARAAGAVAVSVPVLTSPESGIARAGEILKLTA